MAFFAGVVTKLFDGFDPETEGAFFSPPLVNILTALKTGSDTFANEILKLPWSDSEFGQFLVEMTQAEFAAMQARQHTFFYQDSHGNRPKWQHETDVNTAVASASWGHFDDPKDDQSTWNAGDLELETEQLEDRRNVVKFFDMRAAPVQVGIVDCDNDDLDFEIEVRVSSWSNPGTPLPGLDTRQSIKVGETLLAFDFTDGVAEMTVTPNVYVAGGTGIITSNHVYRIDPPGGFTGQPRLEVRVFAVNMPIAPPALD